MSETLFAPAEYHGGEIGAAGYGTAAIGTHQTSSLGGGVVANPGNYGGGCMTGGRRRKKRNGKSKRVCKSKRRGYGRRSMSRSRRSRRGRYSRGGGHKPNHI